MHGLTKLSIAIFFILIILWNRVAITRLSYVYTTDADLRASQKEQFIEGQTLLPQTQSVDVSTRTSVTRIPPSSLKISIVTTWRSGSTFLGDLLSSQPGVFYSYEPLYYFERNNGSKTELIQSLFKCQFSADYLRDMNGLKEHSQNFMLMNRNIWKACQHNRTLCSEPEFVGQLCPSFPIHLMKTVRLRVKELLPLLLDDQSSTNWKIIYLVRDPRGVMSSRTNLNFCIPNPACNDVRRLCSDVEEDLEEVSRLQSLFPGRLYLLKFEDLATNAEKETEKLFKFLGTPVTISVKVFLNQHTLSNKTVGNPFSTVRHSNVVASAWRKKMSSARIANITAVCTLTLQKLGIL